MALTDKTIRAARPRQTAYKLADEKGLFLLVPPSGGLLWRFKYRVMGTGVDGRAKRVEKKLAIGVYPGISLKEARERRDAARKLLADGIDPGLQKRRTKNASKSSAENTFCVIAETCIEKMRQEGLADATLIKRRWFLTLLEPALGKRPLAEITPSEILQALRPIEKRGRLETARRTLNFVGQVFRYGVASQHVASDPTRDLRGALTAPKPKNLAAILQPTKVGALLRAIDGYEGQPVTLLALQLSPHLFVRPGELRRAEWTEIEVAECVWRIPAAKMKARQPHVVPLSTQVMALLETVRGLTGSGRYVFPSVRSGANPMSENTVNAALRRLGYAGDEMTAHGFRATASTLLNESGKWHPDAIERALAHKDVDAVRAAYSRGAFWAERVQMAQWWSDHLDYLKNGSNVVEFPSFEKQAG